MGGNWEIVTRNIFTYVSAMHKHPASLCMLKKTYTYAHINTPGPHSDSCRLGFSISQNKVFASPMTNKLHFRESHPIHIWNIQLQRSAQSIWSMEHSWNWYSVERHWQTLKRRDSESCWKDDFIVFGIPFRFPYNNLPGHFLSAILKVWYSVMNYLVFSCKWLSQLFYYQICKMGILTTS